MDPAPPDAAPAPPRRRRWVRCLWIYLLVNVVVGGALYFGHPLLVPLPNPSTHPWASKSLICEVPLLSARAFQRRLDDFLLDYAFELDEQVHAEQGFVRIEAGVAASYSATLARSRDVVARELAAPEPDPEFVARHARRILALGGIEEARDLLLRAVEGGGGPERADRRLVEGLAEAHLRLAETRNCVGHHAPESCIYPIQGAGVHVAPAPAEAALALFTTLAQRFPQERAPRWLAGIAAMTLGRDPASLPFAVPRPAAGDAPFRRLTDAAQAAGLFNPRAPRAAGGTVLDDLDGDGDLDLVFGGYLPADRLLCYRNRGDGTFVDATAAAGLGDQRAAFRLTQVDVEGDGDLDLFVVRGGWIAPGKNSLLLNDGRGRFTDATARWGLADPIEQSMAAAWADVNGDGRLDLFVANLGKEESSRLYLQTAEQTFRDATGELGLPRLRLCAGAAFGDVDDDGDPDLYVSVAFGQNHLFRNDGGRFTDVTFAAGVARPVASFPVWFFDVDNDGDLDLFCGTFWPLLEEEVASLAGEPGSKAALLRLYKNRGDGTFEDVTCAAGLGVVVSTMGANFGDLDGDGFPELYLGTGSPYLGHLVPNRLFHNQAGRRFAEVTTSAGVGHLQKGHGVAFGDVDRDGDLDLVVNLGGAVPVDRFQPALFKNPGPAARWLELKLIGPGPNRSAIGARIAATLPSNRTVHTAVASGGPFGCSPLSPWLGLGEAKRVKRLVVRWPNGTTTTREDVATNQRLVLRAER